MEAIHSSRYLPSNPEFLLEYSDAVPSEESDDDFDGYVHDTINDDNDIYNEEASLHTTSTGTLFTTCSTPPTETPETPVTPVLQGLQPLQVKSHLNVTKLVIPPKTQTNNIITSHFHLTRQQHYY